MESCAEHGMGRPTGQRLAACPGAGQTGGRRQPAQRELLSAHLFCLICRSCGTSFALYIVSESFAGKRLLERHKLVNLALAPLMPHIHALSIKKAKTPEEEQGAAEKQKPPSQQQAAAM